MYHVLDGGVSPTTKGNMIRFKDNDDTQYSVRALRLVWIEVIEIKTLSSKDVRWTYVIYCAQSGNVKIGVTDDIDERFKTLQSMSPTPLEIKYKYISYGNEIETYFHKRFAAERLHGEWFKFSPEMDKFFGKLMDKYFDDMFATYPEESDLYIIKRIKELQAKAI